MNGFLQGESGLYSPALYGGVARRVLASGLHAHYDKPPLATGLTDDGLESGRFQLACDAVSGHTVSFLVVTVLWLVRLPPVVWNEIDDRNASARLERLEDALIHGCWIVEVVIDVVHEDCVATCDGEIGFVRVRR